MGRLSEAMRERKRQKRLRKLEAKVKKAAEAPAKPVDQNGDDGGPVRPTPEQQLGGAYRFPSGKGRDAAPALNLKPDCIAALMLPPARLTADQHDAALDWREMRLSLLAELGVSQGRSCLDIGPVGHDETDGDPILAERWRAACAVLGTARVRTLDRTCLDGAWPRDEPALCEALDRFAAFATRRLTTLKKSA